MYDHEKIDQLGWEEVLELAKSNSEVARHIKKCPDCRERGTAFDNGMMAAMPAEKRERIIRVASKIASLYEKPHSSN